MKAKMIATEYDEQCALVEYLEILWKQRKILMFTALPNNTWTTSWKQKMKNVMQGIKKGFPDICVITKSKVIFIEMKRSVGGQISADQKAWIEAFNSVGTDAVVCKGFSEAKQFVDKNL